jgi:hypothetical protein
VLNHLFATFSYLNYFEDAASEGEEDEELEEEEEAEAGFSYLYCS